MNPSRENPLLGAQSDALLNLAKSRQPADRERLLMNVVRLCETSGAGGDDDAVRAKAMIDDLFMTLVLDAERAVGAPADVTEEQLLDFLMKELEAFVER